MVVYAADRGGGDVSEKRIPRLAASGSSAVLHVKCVDNLLTFERDELIQELLQQNEREMDVMEILKEVTDDATIQPDET